MGVSVVTGGTIMCSLAVPGGCGQIIGTSQATCLAGGKPLVTIKDVAPMANITPCGMCMTQTNPAVAAATAAALGVPTPAPCIPSPVGMWTSDGKYLVANTPVVHQASTIQCAYGGTISILNPGQSNTLT